MSSYKNSEPRLPIMRGSPPELRLPLTEWDRPPWNRWSFQHVREILPTAEVWRGSGAQSVFPQVPQELGGRGIGSQLARGALDAVRAEGLKVVAQCPFISASIAKHADYQDLVAR